MLHCQLWALKNNKFLKYNGLLNLPGDSSIQGAEWSNFQIFPWKNKSQELAFLSNKFSYNPSDFKPRVSQEVSSVVNFMEKNPLRLATVQVHNKTALHPPGLHLLHVPVGMG